ncbi:MAG: hypothetical protein M0R70_15480 [Nitrospirae bacterium]|nr:hypothetical protein [Nitrospirota bacterium]
MIYADRLVDIIYDGIVTLKTEFESETRFEAIPVSFLNRTGLVFFLF